MDVCWFFIGYGFVWWIDVYGGVWLFVIGRSGVGVKWMFILIDGDYYGLWLLLGYFWIGRYGKWIMFC